MDNELIPYKGNMPMSYVQRRRDEDNMHRLAQMGIIYNPDGSLTEESERIMRAANAVRLGMNMSVEDNQPKPMGFFKGMFIGFVCVIVLFVIIIH